MDTTSPSLRPSASPSASPGPLNDRAIRWLRHVEEGLQATAAATAMMTESGSGGGVSSSAPLTLSALQARRRGSVYTLGALSKPPGARDYNIRGNALLLLRHADRDLEGLQAWMEQYNEDNRARQLRGR